MFPRSRRLSRSHFSRPGAMHGHRFSSEHLSVLIPREGRGYAVIISKKTIRLSVKRHLLKRRILSILRALALPASLVVYPRASALMLPPAILRAELEALVSQSLHTR